MSIEGPESHSQDLFYLLLTEMYKLRDSIPDEELNRAKNILKMNILMAMERKENRIEEVARNY